MTPSSAPDEGVGRGRAAVIAGLAAPLLTALSAAVFWVLAARLATPASVARDATVLVVVRVIARWGWWVTCRYRAAGGRLLAAGVAAGIAAGATQLLPWCFAALSFLRTGPGFALLVPLAAAGTALCGRCPHGSVLAGTGPMLGLARVGALLALAGSGSAHVALVAWTAPLALVTGPLVGACVLRATEWPTSPSTHPDGRGDLAAAVWPPVAAGLCLVLLTRQAGAGTAVFALGMLAALAADDLPRARKPAVLPGLALAVIAAPLALAPLGPGYVEQGTTPLRLLLASAMAVILLVWVGRRGVPVRSPSRAPAPSAVRRPRYAAAPRRLP